MAQMLRLLRNSFDPRTLPNLALWLDAADPATLNLTASNIMQWNDKSGNGNHAAQGVASLQPLYSPSGINGKPSLIFNADQLDIAHNSSIDFSTLTLFCVRQFDDYASASSAVQYSVRKWDGSGFILYTTDLNVAPPRYPRSVGAGAFNNTPAYTTSEGTPWLDALTLDGVTITHTVYPGEITASKSATASITNSLDMAIGHSVANDVTQRIGEVLAYARVLTTPERTAVVAYLKSKWRIT